jgi:hypothetical protein
LPPQSRLIRPILFLRALNQPTIVVSNAFPTWAAVDLQKANLACEQMLPLQTSNSQRTNNNAYNESSQNSREKSSRPVSKPQRVPGSSANPPGRSRPPAQTPSSQENAVTQR